MSCSRITVLSVKQNQTKLPYNKFCIDQACLGKVTGCWPCSFCVLIDLGNVPVNKTGKKDSANKQPS